MVDKNILMWTGKKQKIGAEMFMIPWVIWLQQRCYVEIVFLKNLQDSQENINIRVSF